MKTNTARISANILIALGLLPGAVPVASGQATTKDSADFNHKYEGHSDFAEGSRGAVALYTSNGSAGSFYGGPTVHLDYLRWDDTGAFAPPGSHPTGPPLLAEWECNDGSGPVLSDSSGNGRHGTISGATFLPQGSGHALFLDGRDDYVDCGISGAGGIGISGAVSIEAWKWSRILSAGG